METVFETKTKIVGVTMGNRQELLEELSEMDDISLVRDPNNPHDENAIAVLNPNGEKLGYIRSGLAKELVSYMDLYPDAVLIGEILEITGDEVGKNYGCNIEISMIRSNCEDSNPPTGIKKDRTANLIGNICLVLCIPALIMLFSGKLLLILLGFAGLVFFGTAGLIFKFVIA